MNDEPIEWTVRMSVVNCLCFFFEENFIMSLQDFDFFVQISLVNRCNFTRYLPWKSPTMHLF